jgi:hypothetical protein
VLIADRTKKVDIKQAVLTKEENLCDENETFNFIGHWGLLLFGSK